MTNSQRIQIRMSETREAVNGMVDATTPEDISRRDKLGAELKALEVEFRAAIEAESTVTTRTSPETPESREYRELRERVNVGAVVKAVADGGGTTGAERELQQHLKAGGNYIPLSLLRDEHRAATVPSGDEPSVPMPLIDQVFPSSIMAFAGVDLRERPAGETGYPVITTGVTIHAPAGSAAAAETDGAIAVITLAPKRLQGSLALRREDLSTFAELDGGVRTHLRTAVQSKMDSEVLNRTGDGMLDKGTAPTNPGTATTAATYIAAAYAAVDGAYAESVGDVRVLVGTGAAGVYQHMGKLPVNSGTAAEVSVAEKLASVTGGLRASSLVPAYGSNRQDAVVVKGPARQNIVAATWGVELLPDPFSRAAEGEIRLYVISLFDFAITRTAGFVRHRFRTS